MCVSVLRKAPTYAGLGSARWNVRGQWAAAAAQHVVKLAGGEWLQRRMSDTPGLTAEA